MENKESQWSLSTLLILTDSGRFEGLKRRPAIQRYWNDDEKSPGKCSDDGHEVPQDKVKFSSSISRKSHR